MMYLQFQIILCIGLIFSTSADDTISDNVIDALTSKNLEMALDKFHNCVYRFKINTLQKGKKNINTQLMMLKNLIIDAKIKPDETSTKLLELLELNASQNSEHLKSCCAIFHENLFVVENPMLTMNDDIEASVYSRYTIAFNVLLNCLKKYDCPDIAEKDLSRGFYNRIPNVRNGEPCLKSITKQLLEEVVYKNMTLNDFLISLQNNVYGPNCEKPFARYCIAAYYTYLNSYVPL